MTERQVTRLSKGRKVKVMREGKTIVFGVKSRMEAKLAVKRQIAKLRDKLRRM